MNKPSPQSLLDLVSRYPLSLRSFKKPARFEEPLAHWGFMCGPGWRDIIDEFCAWLEPLAAQAREARKRIPRVTQIASDHGVLDICVTSVPKELRQESNRRIMKARERSATVCAQDGHVRYKLEYTIGEPQVEEYPSEDEARWSIMNEGDHLLKAVRLLTEEASLGLGGALLAFDPQRLGGETMAFEPLGREIFQIESVHENVPSTREEQ